MKRSFTPALFLSVCSLFSMAQDWSLSLSSNVELRTWKLSNKAEKEEKGLGGATIKLFKGTALVNQVSSSGSGDFKINVPANGDFMLEVSYPGCNTKKFAISTQDVPENTAKDNFKPSYSIGGFIMARALPGIDYSYLGEAMVKVVYTSRGQKFQDEESTTNRSLKAMSKIAEAENSLIEKFCAVNREGDAALSKPDCPLAKSSYEKALTLIPGEAYPSQQLTKVDKCFTDKEAADKKAAETASATAAAKAEADKAAKDKTATKAEADKKAVEDAVAKAKADKAAKEQEMNDKVAKAVEKTAKANAAAEKAAAPAQKTEAVASAAQPTTVATPTAKGGPIKIKEKSEDELKAEKRKAGQAKSDADDIAKWKADAAKAEEKQKERKKKAEEETAREQAEESKKQAEREAKQKEEAAKEAADQKTKADAERKKQEEQDARDKEEAKKEEADRAAKAQADQEERDKEEAERAAKEKDARKKTYEKIEKDYNTGKSNASYSTPPVLGSNNVYKEKITQADDHFNNKRYTEARAAYEAALKEKPNDDYATGKLAEISKLTHP